MLPLAQISNADLIKQALSAEVANVVGVVAVFLVIVIVLQMRQAKERQKSEDKVVNLFTNADSPMVQSMKRLGDIQERGITQDEKHTQVLAGLIGKTDEQTTVLKQQTIVLQDFTNFQKTNNDQIADLANKVETTNDRLDRLERSVEGLNTTIQGLPNCETYEQQIVTMKGEIIAAIREQTKRDTSTNVAVNVLPQATLTSDSADAGEGFLKAS